MTSSDGLYLQNIKNSDCSLSKQSVAMKICYSSSNSIYIEAALWRRKLDTYSKFVTLVQASLPISHNETCHRINNISKFSFMENAFVGIKIFNSTNDSGIILNPTGMSNWCVAKEYKTNDNMINQQECTQLQMDVAVKFLFQPTILPSGSILFNSGHGILVVMLCYCNS